MTTDQIVMYIDEVILVLADRFKYNRKNAIKLNKTQLETRKIIENKVNINKYKFENVPCGICNNDEEDSFELLSEKDRYGLYMPVVICKKCGLIQTNPRMTQESYNEFYNYEYRKLYVGAETPTYDFFKSQYKHGKYIYEYMENNLNMCINKMKILEIGTGAGGILHYFKERGNEVYGCDLGSEYVTFGKTHYGLNLIEGTINDVKVNGTPDIIIYSHVLEHILNPLEELLKIKSICRPDTLIYIELPGINNLTNSYDMDFLKYLQNAHVYHFNLTTLKNIMNKSGYELVIGDEIIRSVFRVTQQEYNTKINNEYQKTIEFLKKIEKYRYYPTPYNIKRLITNYTVLSLKRIGFFRYAQSIKNYSLKYRA